MTNLPEPGIGAARKLTRWPATIRVLTEGALIVAFSYAVLLMRQFVGKSTPQSLGSAAIDIITPGSVAIAMVSAAVGICVIEFLRSRSD